MLLSIVSSRFYSHVLHVILACALISLLVISPSSFGEKPVDYYELADSKSGTSITYDSSWNLNTQLQQRFTNSERFIGELTKDQNFIRLTIATYSNSENTFQAIIKNSCLQYDFECSPAIDEIQVFDTSAYKASSNSTNLIMIPLKMQGRALVMHTNQSDINQAIGSIKSQVSTPDLITFKQEGLKIQYPKAFKKIDVDQQSPEDDVDAILSLLQRNPNKQLNMVTIYRAKNVDNFSISEVVEAKIKGYNSYCELLELACNSEQLKVQTLDTKLKPALVIGGWQEIISSPSLVQIYIPAYRGSGYLYIEADSSYPELDKLINHIQFVR